MRDFLPAENVTAAAPWSKRELWVGIVVAISLYVVISLLGVVLIDRMAWQRTPRIVPIVALAQLAMLLPPLFVMVRHGNPLRLVGLHRFRWQMLREMVVMLGIGYCGVLLWGIVLLPWGIQPQEPVLPLFGEGSSAFIGAFLVGAVMAPIVEEIVFRGFLFAGLLKFLSPLPAMLASATLFGALHLQPFAFPALFLLGLLLALLYYRTNSLWPPLLMHFIINSVALIGQYALTERGLI